MSGPVRTSASHPLQIAAVEAGGGRIGVTFAPGKIQMEAASGRWRRDLGADLDVVKAWGAEAVVSLIEQREMDELGIPTLGQEVGARGMEWIHAPIRDYSVPGPEFNAAWPEISLRLRERLSGGGAVLIHCKGGIGRACMVAARLLVELGKTPDDAIALFRRVRDPNAVETKPQERWVAEGPTALTRRDWRP